MKICSHTQGWHHPAIATVCCYESHTVVLSFLCHLYENLKNVVFLDHYILPSIDTLIGLAIYLNFSHKMQSTDGILDWHHPEIATVCCYESHALGLPFLCHLRYINNIIFIYGITETKNLDFYYL